MNRSIVKENYIMPIEKCIGGEDVNNLSDTELLAVILVTGMKNCDVLELSSIVLKKSGSLAGLQNFGIREISNFSGIGLKKAVKIKAAFEIGRRAISGQINIKHIESPEAVWKLLMPDMAGMQKEKFMVLVVNNKNMLLKKALISMGTVSESIVHPREVFRDAIREGGSAIIIAHNHPSGVLSPSKEDLLTTKRIKEAGKIIGIPLLDHVIITNNSYLSLKENGNL